MRSKLARLFENEGATASKASKPSVLRASSDDAVERVLRASFWRDAPRRDADVIDLAARRASREAKRGPGAP